MNNTRLCQHNDVDTVFGKKEKKSADSAAFTFKPKELLTFLTDEERFITQKLNYTTLHSRSPSAAHNSNS